ncbi:MAG: protein-disulfide reductase DsbD N-terminal domain-containing protein [Pirellulales bacterium]|nr:protein-disulfide reductase DsbD N-terminal domain-containing protein [Pirellulales bacterium]
MLKLNQDYWDKTVGRLYAEGKEHWLTMRHQGRLYVFLGKKRNGLGENSPDMNARGKRGKGSPPGRDSHGTDRMKETSSATEVKDQNKKTVGPVTLTVTKSLRVNSGSEFNIQLRLDIQEGWHVYAATKQNVGAMIPLSVRFELPKSLKLNGELAVPEPAFQGLEEIYVGQGVVFTQVLRVSNDAEIGEQSITANVRYQVCNQRVCLPPAEASFPIRVDVAAARAKEALQSR